MLLLEHLDAGKQLPLARRQLLLADGQARRVRRELPLASRERLLAGAQPRALLRERRPCRLELRAARRRLVVVARPRRSLAHLGARQLAHRRLGDVERELSRAEVVARRLGLGRLGRLGCRRRPACSGRLGARRQRRRLSLRLRERARLAAALGELGGEAAKLGPQRADAGRVALHLRSQAVEARLERVAVDVGVVLVALRLLAGLLVVVAWGKDGSSGSSDCINSGRLLLFASGACCPQPRPPADCCFSARCAHLHLLHLRRAWLEPLRLLRLLLLLHLPLLVALAALALERCGVDRRGHRRRRRWGLHRGVRTV